MLSFIHPNKRFGKVIIISYVGNRDGKRHFKVRCNCGEEVILPEHRLTENSTCSKCRSQRVHYGKIDPVGETYGCYLVLNFEEKRPDLQRRFKARCKCGKERIINWKTIQGMPARCPACAATSKDITGQKFGLLTVEGRAGSDRHSQALWYCRCDCGRTSVVRGNPLRTGRIQNCKECGNMQRKKTRTLKPSASLPIYPGPLGCKCQTLAHHITGDGCDECNPELAAQFLRDDKKRTEDELL